MITRVIISTIVLVITNLIVGSISLSLGLLVAATVAAVAVISLILLALLGLCVLFEKLGLVAPGSTDSRLERLRNWVTTKWRGLPGWYKSEKQRIIEMMVQRLRGKETEADKPEAAWKSIALGAGFLLGVLIVRQTLHLSLAWSIGILASGCLLVSVLVLYVRSRFNPPEPVGLDLTDVGLRSVKTVSGSQSQNLEATQAVPGFAVPSPEVLELWTIFVSLYQQGRLNDLLAAASEETREGEKISGGRNVS